MKGLIIKAKWLDKIFNENKIWEIRGSNTNIRGAIELIESGSGLVVGKCNIIGCKELSLTEYQQAKNFHKIEDVDILPYNKTYAWIISNVERYEIPRPYYHPQGAIIWVNL